MNSIKLIQYLKQNNLLHTAQHVSLRLKKVFNECLDYDYEDVIIITDFGKDSNTLSTIMGAGYYLAAKSLDLEPTIIAQQIKQKGQKAEDLVEKTLIDSGFENIIILTTHYIGSTPSIGKGFRKFMSERKHKFVSCTGLASLSNEMLPKIMSSIDINYHEMRKRAFLLKNILDKGKELHVTTPAGTDLWFNIRNKESHSNDGYSTFTKRGGNIPAGEVYIAPRKKKVEGKIVVDGSSKTIYGTTKVHNPISMTIKKGEVIDISGDQEARALEKSIEWAHENSKYPWGVRRLSEFGIGINPGADIIGAVIVDEKAMNTAHVAIGSNHWFGGTVYSIIHLDQIFRNPTIEVDGKPVDKRLYTY